MGLPKFKDVDKSAQDVLSDDYNFDLKLKVKTKTANKMEFTTEGKMAADKLGADKKPILASLAAKFSPAQGITVKKLQVNTKGRLIGEATLSDVAEGLTFTVKAEDGPQGSGKPDQVGTLGCDYKVDGMNSSFEFDVVNGPKLKAGMVFGYEGFMLGGEVKYDTGYDGDSTAKVEDFNGALAYKASDFTAALKSKKSASVLTASYHQDYSDAVAVAATLDYNLKASKDKQPVTVAVGSTYKIDSESSVGAKVDSSAILSLVYNQKLQQGVKLTTSAEVHCQNFADEAHKFGMTLTFG